MRFQLTLPYRRGTQIGLCSWSLNPDSSLDSTATKSSTTLFFMLVDAMYRMLYRAAYQGARIYWRIAKPDNHGALVTIWHGGRVLLIQNSYVRYFSLPGGYVRSHESAKQAAARELKEEIDLDVSPTQLTEVLDHTHVWEGRRDHVTIFSLKVEDPPHIQVDNREVVSATWYEPEDALRQNLFPPIRLVIEQELESR